MEDLSSGIWIDKIHVRMCINSHSWLMSIIMTWKDMLDAQLDNNMKFSIDPHKVRKTRQSETLTHVEATYPARNVWYDRIFNTLSLESWV